MSLASVASFATVYRTIGLTLAVLVVASSHVIDHVGHVSDVVGPLVRDRYVPAGAVGFQRRDGEARSCGDGLEAAVPRLTRRRSAAAVQIEHEGQS